MFDPMLDDAGSAATAAHRFPPVQGKDHRELDGMGFAGSFPSMGGDIERRTIATQLADRIEREIRANVWADELPGKRTLADRYDVNVKTAASAIDLLCRRGLLGPACAGRGRAILPPPETRPARRKRGGKRLLVIQQSGGDLNLEDHALAQQMAACWEKLEGEVAWMSVDFPHCKSPGPLLDALIQRHAPHALLLLSPWLAPGQQWQQVCKRLQQARSNGHMH
jgi:hypothetical protein